MIILNDIFRLNNSYRKQISFIVKKVYIIKEYFLLICDISE